MCLSLAIERPDDVLARGTHEGFSWLVMHNGMGYRCGYVRVPRGHPWHGRDREAAAEDGPDVHGEITFAEADVDCPGDGDDDAWWLGFDCAHGGDAPDLTLPFQHERIKAAYLGLHRIGEIRTQDYVEAECRRLCEQAEQAERLTTIPTLSQE